MSSELLTTEQIRKADQLAIQGGVKSFNLMKAAGKAIAAHIQLKYEKQPILFLCGPGNNGGDGFIAAQTLAKAGWDVELACIADIDDLKEDAASAAALWKGDVIPFEDLALPEEGIVVDALFGTGLTRHLDESVVGVLEAVRDSGLTIVAVDVPSGLNCDTGQVGKLTLKADLTITFFRKKLGHVLMPGAAHCGEIIVADIGIPDDVVDTFEIHAVENGPELWWGPSIKNKAKNAHKYDHGHALILGGKQMTGAGILAAKAAMRVGAGLCTVVTSPTAADVYRQSCPSLIVEDQSEIARFKDHLKDPRRNAILLGPGAGLENKAGLKKAVIDACTATPTRLVVLDADALTVFEDDPKTLHKILGPHCVITPHEGEFAKIFPGLTTGSKYDRALLASQKSKAVVVIKGADTVVADHMGRCVINTSGTGWLATAGTGDVLAGMIVGLAAQSAQNGLTAFDAACAAVWMHGRMAELFGPGLISSDLPDLIPDVLRELLAE